MSLTVPLAQLVLGTIVHGDTWTVIPDIYLAALHNYDPTHEPPYNLTTTYGRKYIVLDSPVLGTRPFESSAQEWQARAALPTWAWHQTLIAGVDPAFTLQSIGVFDSGTYGGGTYLGEFGSTPEAHLIGATGPGDWEIALGPDTDYYPAFYPDAFYAGMHRPIDDSTANDALLIDIVNAVYRGGSLTPHTITYIGLLDNSDTEKSYTGYARQPVTFGAPTSGAQCLSTVDVTFVVPPSAVTTTTRWGAYEASSGGSPVLVGTLGSYGNPAIYENLYTWSAGQIKIQVF